ITNNGKWLGEIFTGMDPMDHPLEMDAFRRIHIARPHYRVISIGIMANNTVLHIPSRTAVQRQHIMTLVALAEFDDLPARYRLGTINPIIGDLIEAGVSNRGLLRGIGIDLHIFIAFDADNQRTSSIIGQFTCEGVGVGVAIYL